VLAKSYVYREAGKFDVPIGNVAKWRDLILKLHDSVLPTSASCLLYMCTPIIQTIYIVRPISWIYYFKILWLWISIGVLWMYWCNDICGILWMCWSNRIKFSFISLNHRKKVIPRFGFSQNKLLPPTTIT
jgi:hypothetical protein